jgi:phage shock protein A
MGIFTRVRDILSSNINAALDKAEDPEKLVKQMIREMEDTLVEIKAACAGAMAQQRKAERERGQAQRHVNTWAERAELAMDRGREELAREALYAKRRHLDDVEVLEGEAQKLGEVVDAYRADILQIEEKLQTARERQKVLVQRHIHAVHRRRAQEEIRKFDTSSVIVRFDQFQQRVERAEAEAEVAGFGRNGHGTLEDQFRRMERDERIERELGELKSRVRAKRSVPVLA